MNILLIILIIAFVSDIVAIIISIKRNHELDNMAKAAVAAQQRFNDDINLLRSQATDRELEILKLRTFNDKQYNYMAIRVQAATCALQGILANSEFIKDYSDEECVDAAMKLADYMVKKIKEQENDNTTKVMKEKA